MIQENSEYFRAVAEVDLSAVKRNLNAVKKGLSDTTDPVAVIKADAYGHGAVRIAKTLEDSVHAFAVATVSEGVQLSEQGIKRPIYILGFSHPSQFDSIIKHSLVPAVFSYSDALLLSECAQHYGKTAYINVKIDSGMGRIGFLTTNESIDEIIRIQKLDNLRIHSFFSHFSTSDEADKSFSHLQSKRFLSFVSDLEKAKVEFESIHISNSSAAMEFPDMLPILKNRRSEARIGIALYGLYPSDSTPRDIHLESAMTIKSHIIHIKSVGVGVPIGYGRSFITQRPSKIATLPIGYADGYQRRLSQKGRVIVNGHYAPIVGKICMDMCMIDITDVPNVSLYDDVILLGSQGGLSVSADEIARLTGTISYEIVCSIGKRVPRVYIG